MWINAYSKKDSRPWSIFYIYYSYLFKQWNLPILYIIIETTEQYTFPSWLYEMTLTTGFPGRQKGNGRQLLLLFIITIINRVSRIRLIRLKSTSKNDVKIVKIHKSLLSNRNSYICWKYKLGTYFMLSFDVIIVLWFYVIIMLPSCNHFIE